VRLVLWIHLPFGFLARYETQSGFAYRGPIAATVCNVNRADPCAAPDALATAAGELVKETT
jgi:hypothetical protein